MQKVKALKLGPKFERVKHSHLIWCDATDAWLCSGPSHLPIDVHSPRYHSQKCPQHEARVSEAWNLMLQSQKNLLGSAWHFFCLPNVRLQPRPIWPISWIDRFPPINLGVCQSKSHLVIRMTSHFAIAPKLLQHGMGLRDVRLLYHDIGKLLAELQVGRKFESFQ